MKQFNDVACGTDPLAALRHATASRHERLDAGLPLSGDQAGLADYHQHLCLLREWLGPLQAWLAGFDDGPQGGAEERLALIEADLAFGGQAHMGFPPARERRSNADAAANSVVPAKAGTRVPMQAAALPFTSTPAYRWGICYVIEGSQLGGAVLYQRLSARLSPHPLRYLRGAPEGPGPRWRGFMLALRANVRTEQEIADACAGACEAFDRILSLAFPPTGSPPDQS